MKYIVKNYSDQILFARLCRKSVEGNKHLDVIGRFRYIMAVSFIGGGNQNTRRKPQQNTCTRACKK
jgi:hypothetical protein